MLSFGSAQRPTAERVGVQSMRVLVDKSVEVEKPPVEVGRGFRHAVDNV